LYPRLIVPASATAAAHLDAMARGPAESIAAEAITHSLRQHLHARAADVRRAHETGFARIVNCRDGRIAKMRIVLMPRPSRGDLAAQVDPIAELRRGHRPRDE